MLSFNAKFYLDFRACDYPYDKSKTKFKLIDFLEFFLNKTDKNPLLQHSCRIEDLMTP